MLRTLLITYDLDESEVVACRSRAASLKPKFHSDKRHYSVEVPHTVEDVQITAVAPRPLFMSQPEEIPEAATVAVSGGTDLRIGVNKASVKVVAPGTTEPREGVYTINIRRCRDPRVVQQRRRLAALGTLVAGLTMVLMNKRS